MAFPMIWRRKGNCISGYFGAGDGNRTHVRNLGSCRHLASEAIPKRQNQGGGFGALQAPATNRLITGSSSALRMITLAGSQLVATPSGQRLPRVTRATMSRATKLFPGPDHPRIASVCPA